MSCTFVQDVRSMADLKLVDSHVRTLCRTAAGAQCQTLLTTEYQNRRREVAMLVNDSVAARALTASGALHAYMDGITLKFVQPTCVITWTMSGVPYSLCGKRKASRNTPAAALCR